METLEVRLPEELLRRLDQRAQDAGEKDRATYVRALIEKDVAAKPTLRDIFAPVREEIRASGMTDDEVSSLLEECREEAYQERKARGTRGE